MTLFSVLKNAALNRSTSDSARRPRRHAAPAIGILLLALTAGLSTGLSTGSASAASSGTLTVSPSGGAFATLARSRTNSKTVASIKVPSSLPFVAAIQLRSAAESSGYRAKVSIAANGAMTVSLSRVVNSLETVLGTPQGTGLTVTPGKTIRLQGAVAGSNPVRLFVRAWKSGSKAPKWRLAARDYDASRITKAGKARLWVHLPSTAPTAARVTFSKASTSATSVRKVKSFKVKTWFSVSGGTAAPTGIKPSAATTGVRPGSRLTRHNGDITVTKDGTVLSNLDIHGFVVVRARNVTISNSIVRGGKSKGFATGLITDYGYSGLLITDTRIVPAFPSVWFDGIKGSGFTARRVHITGGVDSVKIQGDNTTVQDSLLENTDYYANDPQQNGGPTHNDNIQIQNGKNVNVTGNTIRGASNFAILGAASKGNLNLVVKNNWLDGGHCTVKLQVLSGHSETATVTGNKFGPNRKVSSCAFTAYPAVNLTQSGNTLENSGSAVKPLIVVS